MKNTDSKINIYSWLIIAGVVAFIFLWFQGCFNQKTTVPATITTPVIEGKFESQKPIQKPISTEPKYRSKKGEVQNLKNNNAFYEAEINKLLQENEKLNEAFDSATDSMQKVMYSKSNQLNEFKQTFDNTDLKADVSGVVRGEIQSMDLKYTIKPQTIEVPKQKEVVFRMLGGGGFGINKELNQTVYKVNVGFQNRKGNIIRGSYQKIGSQDFYLAEYDISIFKIKGK